MFHIVLFRETQKSFLSEITTPNLDIWIVASPCGLLPSSLKVCPWGQKWPLAGVTYANIKSTFSEYGHLAYHIKENEAYNNMLANILLLHSSFAPGWNQNINLFYFLKVVILHN